jgi:hypothetical protein
MMTKGLGERRGKIIMARTETIRDFSGRFIAIYEYHDNGDITVRDWSSRMILGYYRKKYDHTTDFYGRVLYKGNAVGMLIGRK